MSNLTICWPRLYLTLTSMVDIHIRRLLNLILDFGLKKYMEELNKKKIIRERSN